MQNKNTTPYVLVRASSLKSPNLTFRHVCKQPKIRIGDLAELDRLCVEPNVFVAGNVQNHNYVAVGIYGGVVCVVERYFRDVGHYAYEVRCNSSRAAIVVSALARAFGSDNYTIDDTISFVLYGYGSINPTDHLCNRLNAKNPYPVQREKKMSDNPIGDMLEAMLMPEENDLGNLLSEAVKAAEEKRKLIERMKKLFNEKSAEISILVKNMDLQKRLAEHVMVIEAMSLRASEYLDQHRRDKMMLIDAKKENNLLRIKNDEQKKYLRFAEQTVAGLEKKLASAQKTINANLEDAASEGEQGPSKSVEFRQIGNDVYALYLNEGGVPEVSIVMSTLLSGGTVIISPVTAGRYATIRLVSDGLLVDDSIFEPVVLGDVWEAGKINESDLLDFYRVKNARPAHRADVTAVLKFVNGASIR